MSCYTPLLLGRCGDRVLVLNRMEAAARGISPGDIRADPLTGEVIQYLNVPCGQCIGCRLDHSREWANRCVMETIDHDPASCWFATLTYDDDHVPISDSGCYTLDPPTLSAWIKRLRRAAQYHYGIDDGIRYYACGEYGTHTARPHYHVLLYGLPIDSGPVVARNKFGDPFYRLPLLEETWNQGIVSVGRITWQSAAYTARYCLKKWKGNPKDDYLHAGIANEFVRMSRRPGIGGSYLADHLDDIYPADRIVLPSDHGRQRVVRPPRYADTMLDRTDPDLLQEIKERRQLAAENLRALREQSTDLDEDEYLNLLKTSAQINLEKKLPRPDF